LNITGGTITTSGANYAVVSVATTGVVILTGQGYTETKQIHGVYDESLDPSTPQNILNVDEATLVHGGNVDAIAECVFNYYQKRYRQTVTLYAPDIEIGKSASIETYQNNSIVGIIEKLDMDLSGGYRVKTEISGEVAT